MLKLQAKGAAIWAEERHWTVHCNEAHCNEAHRNEAHFTYICVYHTNVFEADNIYKKLPPNVISPKKKINFFVAVGLHLGALTDPHLPAAASNACTTDVRPGGVGRVAPPQTKFLATPVVPCGPILTRFAISQSLHRRCIGIHSSPQPQDGTLGSLGGQQWNRKHPLESLEDHQGGMGHIHGDREMSLQDNKRFFFSYFLIYILHNYGLAVRRPNGQRVPTKRYKLCEIVMYKILILHSLGLRLYYTRMDITCLYTSSWEFNCASGWLSSSRLT